MSSVKRPASEVYGELVRTHIDAYNKQASAKSQLEQILEEQRKTNELLGEVVQALSEAKRNSLDAARLLSGAATITKITPVAQLSVLDVLEMCEREFAFIGGGTMTDMPDVPLSPATSWTMDFSQVLAAIAVAKEKLGGFVDCCTAGECAGCSNPQPMEPASATPKFEPEHLDTGKASKDST